MPNNTHDAMVTSRATIEQRGPSGSVARRCSTTAFAISTIESRKCAITMGGERSTSTVMPPSTIWAATPATSPQESHTRSACRGTRHSEPSTARITAADTKPVMVRFVNSIIACFSNGATRRPSTQFGQSGHPSPDPVSRTAAPLTTIAASDRSAPSVKRRYSFGVIDGRRTVGS